MKIIKSEKKIFIRFCVTGGCSTFLDFIFYRRLLIWEINIFQAKLLSMSVVMFLSYIVNSCWSFRSVRTKKNGELFRYAICQGVNLGTNVFVNCLMVRLFNSINISYLAATGAGMAVNFLLQRYWVFGGEK